MAGLGITLLWERHTVHFSRVARGKKLYEVREKRDGDYKPIVFFFG
jgi:hypothetical protein